MVVVSTPKIMLSSSLKAATTRWSELVMLPGSVVFPSIESQPAKASSQLSAKKANASILTSLEDTSLICEKSPSFALLALSRRFEVLRPDTVLDVLGGCGDLCVVAVRGCCGCSNIAMDREQIVLYLESKPVPMYSLFERRFKQLLLPLCLNWNVGSNLSNYTKAIMRFGV